MDDLNLFRGDDGTALRFFSKPIKNNFLSEKAGRPVFDTGIYVEIITPGSTESVPEMLIQRTFAAEAGTGPDGERKVERTNYAKRFEKQFEAYMKNTGEHAVDGTPITAWPLIDAGTAATLKAQGVFTVEGLADVSDANLQNLGVGGRHLRDKAKAFLTARQFSIPVAQQAAETAELRDKLTDMTLERDSLRSALADANAELERLRGAAVVQPAPAPEEPALDPLAMPPTTRGKRGGGSTPPSTI